LGLEPLPTGDRYCSGRALGSWMSFSNQDDPVSNSFCWSGLPEINPSMSLTNWSSEYFTVVIIVLLCGLLSQPERFVNYR